MMFNGRHVPAQTKIKHRKLNGKSNLLTMKRGMSDNGNTWSGTMGKHYLNIQLAWSLATIPMFILAMAFLATVESSRPRITKGSFYSDGQQADIPLGSAIYSKIPATQLTFMVSFSATLATALLPASMALYSYIVALAITTDSDSESENWKRLLSPYQLQLIINSLSGSLLALWSFACYVFSPRRKRVAVVPHLWRAVWVLGTMALLAYAFYQCDKTN